MIVVESPIQYAATTGGADPPANLYFKEAPDNKVEIFARPVGWDLAKLQTLKRPGLSQEITVPLHHNHTIITGGVLRDPANRPIHTDGILGLEAKRLEDLGEKVSPQQKDSLTSVQSFFEKLSFPNATEVQNAITQIQTFSSRPKDAARVRDTLYKQVNVEQIMARSDTPPVVKTAYQKITQGASASQFSADEKYIYDAVRILMGVGKVEGTIIAEDQVVNPETVVVDDINQIYRYLDGGRVYPAALSAEQTLTALRQIVPALTLDAEFKNDLRTAGGNPEKMQIKEIPINSFALEEAGNTATLNITVPGPMGEMKIDLIIANADQATGSGISIDIKDPGLRGMAQQYAGEQYILIGALPDLLRKHINRNLRYKSVSGFGIQSGKFIFNGGPKTPTS